jgi:hypothetical protein
MSGCRFDSDQRTRWDFCDTKTKMQALSDLILFAHPTLGVFAILAALWVFVEALNADVSNLTRLRRASLACAVCMVGAWLLGGYWYVTFYTPEKAIILRGPWPFAHNLFMETKEHLFFIPLILGICSTRFENGMAG